MHCDILEVGMTDTLIRCNFVYGFFFKNSINKMNKKKYERRKWNKPRKRKQLKRQQIETTKIQERKINGKKRKKINIEYCVIISRGGVLVLRANCVKKKNNNTHTDTLNVFWHFLWQLLVPVPVSVSVSVPFAHRLFLFLALI